MNILIKQSYQKEIKSLWTEFMHAIALTKHTLRATSEKDLDKIIDTIGKMLAGLEQVMKNNHCSNSKFSFGLCCSNFIILAISVTTRIYRVP